MGDVRRTDGDRVEQDAVTLDDLAREGARRMIATALEAEVEEYVASFAEELDEDGKRLVVRNGRAKERRLTIGSGTVGIRAPRVNDKRVDEDGERQRFGSKILPAYARRSPKVTEALPVLYLHGLSTGDCAPALRDLLGSDASGLSPSSISRLTTQWEADHDPKAVEKLDRDWDQLTAFFDFPAEHWRHLRTTNPIESSFATVKLRTRVTKGAGSKKAALAMAYKLLDAAQACWRRFNGHELIADVLDGVTFKDGIKAEDTNYEKEIEKVAA